MEFNSWKFVRQRRLMSKASLATVLIGLLALAGSAFAQVSYQYTGNPFAYFSCGPSSPGPGTLGCFNDPAPGNTLTSYKATDHISATLTLSVALAPNLTLQDVTGLAGYQLTMSDGEQTYSSATTPSTAQVSTDASGNIIAPWVIAVHPTSSVDAGITSQNEPPPAGAIDQAIIACCDPVVSGNLALNFTPGTWGSGGGTGGGSFPTGAFTRVTQFTECCSGVVVDNDDVISGGIGQPRVFSGAGSQLGANWGAGQFTQILLNGSTATNNGPSAGAWSDANQGAGFGRGIAFATITNNSGADAVYKANANLNGEFVNDVWGLPNGQLAAGAAVHVFDTDKFNAAVSAAIATDVANGMTVDQAVGKFLLGGPTATAGRDPATDFTDMNSRLSGALLAHSELTYANGPFNPPAPITTPLNTSSFTVKNGQSFTVMFDVIASGVVEGSPDWAIGTGTVNFLDTLKPAANFITDQNGNPVTGLSVVGGIPALPPAAGAVSLTPSTGSSPLEKPYTLTATVTDSSHKPVQGTGVKFKVLSGPSAGVSGVGVTDSTGTAKFTYVNQGGTGTDVVQATTGSVTSNNSQVNWTAARCPQPQGYWKNNPAKWPYAGLTLGSQSYTQAELLSILNTPGGGDASMILAVQLIAAKLDVANGSDPTPIKSAAANADNALSAFSGKLPYGVKASTTAGKAMTQAASTLQAYTVGQLTPGCTQ